MGFGDLDGQQPDLFMVGLALRLLNTFHTGNPQHSIAAVVYGTTRRTETRFYLLSQS